MEHGQQRQPQVIPGTSGACYRKTVASKYEHDAVFLVQTRTFLSAARRRSGYVSLIPGAIPGARYIYIQQLRDLAKVIVKSGPSMSLTRVTAHTTVDDFVFACRVGALSPRSLVGFPLYVQTQAF